MKKEYTLLQELQASTYLLLIKTHNFHWNVKGELFQSLHTLFENQYNDLFQAVDMIAERIRAKDHRALGSPEEFQKASSIKSSKESKWKKMVQELVDDHQMIVDHAKKLVHEAEKENDAPTGDLAIQRIREHEKAIWMLKSHLE